MQRNITTTLLSTLHWLSAPALVALLATAATPGSTAGELQGRWQQKSQLIWDQLAERLVRHTVRVWDAHPEADLEFYWEPEGTMQAGEIIEGRGTLTWRRRGTPNY